MWIASIITGFLIDCVAGDPYKIPHPVVLMGRLIAWIENFLRKFAGKSSKNIMLLLGAFEVFIVVVVSSMVPYLILWFAKKISVLLAFAVSSIMCWQIIAARSLKKESMKVYRSLKAGDLEAARSNVAMIVGRDTDMLSEEGIIKAAVETVAENTSDGVIAPLFYLFLGGPVLGFAYKAINTMDSMLGYKNEKYLYYGKCAARLDDAVNYIPARISAWAMIMICPLLNMFAGKEADMDVACYYHISNAVRIWKRDKRKHASPNSAQTEAVCAGALGIQLAGDAWYGGKRLNKEFIGEKRRSVEKKDIRRACLMMYGASILILIIFTFVKVLYLSLRV